jgi:hypothetical protein
LEEKEEEEGWGKVGLGITPIVITGTTNVASLSPLAAWGPNPLATGAVFTNAHAFLQ